MSLTVEKKEETPIAEAAAGSVQTEQKPETSAVGGKKKIEKTGNLLVDVAHEVEAMSKVKALNEADRLAENIEVNYFKLGGVLKLISDNSWFEGFATFDDFVEEHFGFAVRKARYLIEIYDNLVTKQIVWEKVSGLGWTKLTRLCKVLTPDNTDEWVAKVEKLTVKELDALLKTPEGSETTQSTTDEIVKISFKFKPDQAEVVKQAIAKAKGELKTEFDTVAVENIMAGYVGGLTSVNHAMPSIEDFVNAVGFEPLLLKVAELYPMYDINLSPAAATE